MLNQDFCLLRPLLKGQSHYHPLQYNLLNPNLIVDKGDKFKYNYNLFADVINAYSQVVFKYNKLDFYLAASYTDTNYQREGIYQSEVYADNSLGMGPKVKFTGVGAKAGFTYKFSGSKS